MNLALKYRPAKFDDVVGQVSVVKSLKKLVKERAQHAYLFTGPSGTGKTTLARIVLGELGVDEHNLREVDAATNTGIDAMREVAGPLVYAPVGGGKARGLIIDEAHALSKAAWDSLLKAVEEPPAHVFWCFCTTAPAKVPKTIQTRCAAYELTAIKGDTIFNLLVKVAEAERFPVSDEVLSLVADCALGSPRQALMFLAQVSEMTEAVDALPILRKISEESEPVVRLCRGLWRRELNWPKAMEILDGLEEEGAEGIRAVVLSWFTKAVRNPKSTSDEVKNGLAVLEAFSASYAPSTNLSPVLLSLGGLLL